MNRVYFSIEFNFRDKDGNPVDKQANGSNSIGKDDYAGHDHDFWHGELNLNHAEGVCADVATDIECYLTRYPDEETFGLMDRVHISIPKPSTVERKLEIWGGSDDGVAVVDANFPPYHANFLIVGFSTRAEALEDYPNAEIKTDIYDWDKYSEINDPDYERKEEEQMADEFDYDELDQQLIAYAMYYFGKDGRFDADLDDGYPLYTAYNKAQDVANSISLRTKQNIIMNDDLNPNVVAAAIEDLLGEKELKGYCYYNVNGFSPIIEIVQEDGSPDGKRLTHLSAPQTVEVIEATAKSFGITNLDMSDTDLRPEKAYRKEAS